MKKINEEKFLADYEIAVKEREELEANKEIAINAEKEKLEGILATYDSSIADKVRITLGAEIIAEKEKEFDSVDADKKISGFEKYLDDIEEEVIEDAHPEGCECAECLEEKASEITEVKSPAFDEFGNIIA